MCLMVDCQMDAGCTTATGERKRYSIQYLRYSIQNFLFAKTFIT
jgi:hypothetical protein